MTVNAMEHSPAEIERDVEKGSSVMETTQHSGLTPQHEERLICRAGEIIAVEKDALNALTKQLNQDFAVAIRLMKQCQGRVVISGMGKSGLIGKKIAATLSSTGTPSIFLHPAEGTHGDLGALTQHDVVVAISNSGETPEMLNILPVVKRFEIPLIAMTGKVTSTLAKQATAVLNIAVPKEACSLGLAPTSSTTATLAMGDALAVVLLEEKGFTEEDFALFHPAGSLGKRLLLRVSDLMHTGDAIPVVQPNTCFVDVLSEMSQKMLGMTLVMDLANELHTHSPLMGVITDGDIRRYLTREGSEEGQAIQSLVAEKLLASPAGSPPKSIESNALAVEALRMMESNKITTLVVMDENNSQQVVGVLHLHQLIQSGIA